MKRTSGVVLGSLILLILTVTVALAAGAPRETSLNGSEEPGGADPDGTGFAKITLNVGQQTVCWELWASNIVTPTASHIHRAAFGVNGPVVVPLSPPVGGYSAGCRENVDPELIQAIIDFPENYYVNVHNSVYPGGAIRGQLSNRGQSD